MTTWFKITLNACDVLEHDDSVIQAIREQLRVAAQHPDVAVFSTATPAADGSYDFFIPPAAVPYLGTILQACAAEPCMTPGGFTPRDALRLVIGHDEHWHLVDAGQA